MYGCFEELGWWGDGVLPHTVCCFPQMGIFVSEFGCSAGVLLVFLAGGRWQ